MAERFPPGGHQERVQKVLDHYDTLPEDAVLAEDQAAFEAPGQTVMVFPSDLVPAIRELIAKHGSRARLGQPYH
jgi:hypothetical protein